MIGLALVTFVTVFAAGISKSVGSVIDDNFQGDLTIQATDGFSPIPNKVEPAVASAAEAAARFFAGPGWPWAASRCRARSPSGRRAMRRRRHRKCSTGPTSRWKSAGPAFISGNAPAMR